MSARRLVLPAATAALFLGTALPAHAVTCYVVMDRSDNVIYRDVVPPVDLSDAGRTAREAMRMRGEYFLFHEAENCPRVEFFTGNAGSVSLALDQTAPATPRPAAVPGAGPAPAAATPANPAARPARR